MSTQLTLKKFLCALVFTINFMASYSQEATRRDNSPNAKINWEELNKLTEEAYLAGEYEKAFQYCEQAVVQAEKEFGKRHLNYALALNNLGILYSSYKLDYKKAEPLYRQALRIYEEVNKENLDYGICLDNLAILYHDLGNYSKAELFYVQALSAKEKASGKENADYATSLNNLAELYREEGNYARAEALYEQSLVIFEKVLGKSDPNYALVLGNLAFLCQAQGSYAKAEHFFIQTLDVVEKTLGKEHPSYATVLNNLGFLYEKKGLYAKAELLHLQALSIREKTWGKDHLEYALSLNSLAVLYSHQGNDSKAEALFLQAYDIFEKNLGKDHPDCSKPLNNLALMYNMKRNLAKSEPYFLGVNENMIKQIDRYFPTLSESEREGFYKTLKNRFETFNSFALKRKEQNPAIVGAMYNNQLATKALLFTTSNKIRNRILLSKDTALIHLYQDWQAKRNALGKTFQMSLKEKQNANINVEQLEEEINTLEKKLSSQSEIFKREREQKLYTWQDVQRSLNKREAAIEIIRFRKFGTLRILTDSSDVRQTRYRQYGLTDTAYYAALIVTPQSKLPELVLLENGTELETRYLKYYKNSIQFKLPDTLSYKKFWKPVADRIRQNKNIKTVYISPDGFYNAINLQTLQNPATKKYVVEESNIRLVTNTKDLINWKREHKKNFVNGAALFGYPDYSRKDTTASGIDKKRDIAFFNTAPDSIQRLFAERQIKRLPGTRIEIDAINKLLVDNQVKAVLYMERLATEEEIKALRSPAILHIATHGFFLHDIVIKEDRTFAGFDAKKFVDNPLLRSGLLLAGSQQAVNGSTDSDSEDGILTAYEAMNLTLDDTELVILSACETGLGEIKNGEGVYGLQRAFQTAGAWSLLMSLWKVDDNATQELMILFYKNWLESGDKYEALLRAQSSLKAKYKHPYYWGAFVLVGD